MILIKVSQLKKTNRLLKDLNSLLSKGMSKIHLKVTIEKIRGTQKVRLQVSCWGAPAHADIIEISNFMLQSKNQRSASKKVCGFCLVFISKGIMTFQNQRAHGFCGTKL